MKQQLRALTREKVKVVYYVKIIKIFSVSTKTPIFRPTEQYNFLPLLPNWVKGRIRVRLVNKDPCNLQTKPNIFNGFLASRKRQMWDAQSRIKSAVRGRPTATAPKDMQRTSRTTPLTTLWRKINYNNRFVTLLRLFRCIPDFCTCQDGREISVTETWKRFTIEMPTHRHIQNGVNTI